MEANSKTKHKIVFLIDCNLSVCHCCSSNSRKHIDGVLASVLRILFHHSSHSNSRSRNQLTCVSTKDGEVTWSYKLFSTCSALPRSKAVNAKSKSEFQAIDVQNFDTFARRVHYLFEEIKSIKEGSVPKPCAERLSVALTEILHDFSWENQNILDSPVTLRSHKQSRLTKLVEKEVACKNSIYIISKVPKNSKALRWFSNKVVLDSDVFIDSFMSPVLVKEYERLNIAVNWLDVGTGPCKQLKKSLESGVNAEAVSLVEEAVHKLRGAFISQDYLLQKFVVENTREDPVQGISAETFLMCTDLTSKQCKSASVKILADASIIIDVSLIPISDQESQSTSNGTTGEETSMASESEDKLQLDLIGCVPFACCHTFLSELASAYIVQAGSNQQCHFLIRDLFKTKSIGILKGLRIGASEKNIAILKPLSSEIGAIMVQPHCPVGDKKKVEEDRSKSLKKLSQDLKQLQLTKTVPASKCTGVEKQRYQTHCLNRWHVPGSTRQVQNILAKINERSNHLTFLSLREKSVLRDLQKMYRKEAVPVEVIWDPPPSTSTPVCDLSTFRRRESLGSDSGSRSSLSGNQRSALSRGRMMVDKAKSSSFLDLNTSSGSKPEESPDSRLSQASDMKDLCVDTEESLSTFLKKQYAQVLEAGIAMEASAQTMMTVTSRFMADKEVTNPQAAAVEFIQKHLILSLSQLKEKYDKKREEADTKNKIAEFKLQILLLLEMEALLLDHDEAKQEVLVTELVSLLRVLSFLLGATGLRDYMTSSLVQNYQISLPRVLVQVYDELMLPLPSSLAKLTSPSGPSSVWGDNPSLGGRDSIPSAPGSLQTFSNSSDQQNRRSSRFKSHPSLSDFGQKRQILVAKPAKPKEKANGKAKAEVKKRVRSASKSKHKVSKKILKDLGSAKRNLFSSAPADQEKRKKKLQTTPKRRKRHSGKSRLLVPGTPAHKQTSGRILARHERRRQRYKVQCDVQVVAESPVKADSSPLKPLNKPAHFVVRESFYSSNSQTSRNCAKFAEQQAQSGLSLSQSFVRSSQGSLASAVRGESPFLSPRSRFMKSLLASPSPEPKSNLKERISLRRSPRKPVKRLDFQMEIEKQPENLLSSAGSDAHLIFDGENASDFSIFRSPSKRALRLGIKTPEKVRSTLFLEDVASCPPILSTPPKKRQETDQVAELSFRNMFSTNDQPGPSSNRILFTSRTASCTVTSATVDTEAKHASFYNGSESTPKKHLYTPEKFKVGSPSQSPKVRATPSRNHARNLMFEEEKIPEVMSTPKKHTEVMSTPKKHTNSPDVSHLSTPSKVKFSKYNLISPPTGSGYPPSAEKMTPGKSILKKSPAFKGRPTRRVELQPVSSTSPSSSSFLDKINASCPQQGSASISVHNSDQTSNSSKSLSALSVTIASKSEENSGPYNCNESEGSSPDLFSTDKADQATVLIRTPSPASKLRKTDSINQWVRRKSSRQRSPSSSPGSVTSKSPRTFDSKTSQSSEGSQAEGKENADIARKPLYDQAESPIKSGRIGRKRILSFEERMMDSPSKRPRRLLNPTSEETSQHPNFERQGTEAFGSSSSPDIIVTDSDNETFSNDPSAVKEVLTQSSQSSNHSQPTVYSEQLSPFRLSPTQGMSSHLSDFAECSQGFQVEIEPTSVSKKEKVVKSDLFSQSHSSDKTAEEKAHTSTVKNSPRKGHLLRSNSSTSNSNESPKRVDSVSSTPDQKQYSPALSATGLLQLIKSPLVGDSGSKLKSNKQITRTRSKTRKHLDLN